MDAFDVMGLFGVCSVLYAYTRVQWRREYAKKMEYSLANFFGALLLVVSLLNKWNVASFAGNLIWLFISLYGIYRCAKYARKGKRKTARKEDYAASKP